MALEKLRLAVNLGREGAEDFVAPASLYVHVPVCASKCSYCDFFSVPAPSLDEGFETGLVEGLLRRASVLAERFGADSFSTVYIGGGTPSLLSASALARLVSGIGALARGQGSAGPREWTVEANPDSITREKLEVLAAHGVTRLSLGVQSLDADDLRLLERRHGPEAALASVRAASQAGLAVSADLIAALPQLRCATTPAPPTDRLASFAAELLDAGAGHLSVYDLSLEAGTALEARKGLLRFPGEDADWESRQSLEDALALAGLRRYEVSNYAKRGRECLHNLAYWHMDSYLGAGPGAVSTLSRRDGSSLRIEEPRSLPSYGLEGGPAALETEISLGDALFETIMMSFRTSFGLDLESFRSRFGVGAESLIGGSLSAWRSHLIQGEPWPWMDSSGGPALDSSGLDILNRFLASCLSELEKNSKKPKRLEKRTAQRES